MYWELEKASFVCLNRFLQRASAYSQWEKYTGKPAAVAESNLTLLKDLFGPWLVDPQGKRCFVCWFGCNFFFSSSYYFSVARAKCRFGRSARGRQVHWNLRGRRVGRVLCSDYAVVEASL